MRYVCPDATNMCKTDEIPNPQNIPGNMFVSWLHVDKLDQLNMSYTMSTMVFLFHWPWWTITNTYTLMQGFHEKNMSGGMSNHLQCVTFVT